MKLNFHLPSFRHRSTTRERFLDRIFLYFSIFLRLHEIAHLFTLLVSQKRKSPDRNIPSYSAQSEAAKHATSASVLRKDIFSFDKGLPENTRKSSLVDSDSSLETNKIQETILGKDTSSARTAKGAGGAHHEDDLPRAGGPHPHRGGRSARNAVARALSLFFWAGSILHQF